MSLVYLLIIQDGWGLVWPRYATYSNGTGALAHPQGKPHGASLGNSLRLPTSCHSSSLQTLTLCIAHTDQHTTSILKQLLLSHDPLWIVFVRGVFPDEPIMAPSSATCHSHCAIFQTVPICPHQLAKVLYYEHNRERAGVSLMMIMIATPPAIK